jgi:hypothetical protein
LVIMFMSFGLLAHKDLIYLAFLSLIMSVPDDGDSSNAPCVLN